MRMPAAQQRQVPSVYRTRVGEALVTVLGDGHIEASLDLALNIGREEGARLLEEARRGPEPRISINAFAVQSGARLALVDAGAGDSGIT